MPWVAYGYDRPHSFQFLTQQDFPEGTTASQLQLIEHAAVRNLRTRPASWRSEKIRMGLFRSLRVAICADDFFSAEHILDEAFMQEAQAQLGAKILAVSVPRRGLMIATDFAQPHRLVSGFAVAMSAQYHRGESAPITPLLFAVQDGQIVGMTTGTEEAGRTLVEAEAREHKDVYLKTMHSTHKVTGLRSLHILTGGPDFDRMAAQVVPTFAQGVQSLIEDGHFSGKVHLVLIPDLVPERPALRHQMAHLVAHLHGVASELGFRAPSGAPIEINVRYGAEPWDIATSDAIVPDDD